MGSHLGIDFGAIWEDFGSQVGTENRIGGRLRAAREVRKDPKGRPGAEGERFGAAQEVRKASVRRVTPPGP